MRRRNRILVSTFGWALAVCSLSCSSPPPEVPLEIRGRWTTSDARFEGRSLELGANTVTFATGLEPPTLHAVTRIDQSETSSDESRDFAVDYLVDDSPLTLSFRFDRSAQTLTLENRPEVRWTREDA